MADFWDLAAELLPQDAWQSFINKVPKGRLWLKTNTIIDLVKRNERV